MPAKASFDLKKHLFDSSLENEICDSLESFKKIVPNRSVPDGGREGTKSSERGKRKKKARSKKRTNKGGKKAGEFDNRSNSQGANNKPADKPARVVPCANRRGNSGNKPIGSNGNDDSDSDGGGKGKVDKIERGHYAGLPGYQTSSQEDVSMSTQEDESKHMKEDASMETESSEKGANVVEQPIVESYRKPEKTEQHLLLDHDNVAWERLKNRRCRGLGPSCLNIAKFILMNIIHYAFKRSCKCEDICKKGGDSVDFLIYAKLSLPKQWELVDVFIQHVSGNCQKDWCKSCALVDFAICQHARDCEYPNCPVPRCQYFKDMVCNTAHEKRNLISQVLHSTSPSLFKEGQLIREDLDYTFLYEKRINAGTFGEVSRVWFYHQEKNVEADIIVKKVTYDPTKEAEIHKLLREDHPNILSAMAVIAFMGDAKRQKSETDKDIRGYILMARAEFSLFHLKKSFPHQRIPLMDSVYIWAQFNDGLAYLHLKRIIHKDIKDLNILMTEGGQRAKICDWDSAYLLKNEMTGRLPLHGTPGFTAPEVLKSLPHSTAADVFSGAVTFLEICLGGQYYDKANGKRESQSSYDDRRKLKLNELEEMNSYVHRVVTCCLQPDPTRRPTALDLKKSKVLSFTENYSIKVPDKIQSPDRSLPGNVIDPIYFDHVASQKGEDLRSKVDAISGKDETGVLADMDQLPKELPSENIPASNEWIGAMHPVEEGTPMECSDG